MQVHLNGFLRSDYVVQGRLIYDIAGAGAQGAFAMGFPPTPIQNARELQSQGATESDFFDTHSFVLMQHDTSVRDWDNDVRSIYQPEIEALIRQRLLPGLCIEIPLAYLLRRGAGTPVPTYGVGVHSDYALTADDYQEQVEAFSTPEYGQLWRNRYEQDDVVGFMVINFWRTTNMIGSLKHMPLAVCDVESIDLTDVVATGLQGFAPSGKTTNQLGLRFNAHQKWYYYPDMVGTEVLAFKNFQCFKQDTQPRLQSCFHTAFEHPDTPDNAELRQSCEFRVNVFLLREGCQEADESESHKTSSQHVANRHSLIIS